MEIEQYFFIINVSFYSSIGCTKFICFNHIGIKVCADECDDEVECVDGSDEGQKCKYIFDYFGNKIKLFSNFVHSTVCVKYKPGT